MFRREKTNGHRPGAGGLVAEIAPKSPAAEAYRTLRANIQFAGLDLPVRTLVVTSASAGEGKSTTAANFAVVTAQAGSRVCLIDADLRRPTLHETFNLKNNRGLTAALVDGGSLVEVAQRTRIPNLSVVSSGPRPPNPSELLSSKRMREVLTASHKDFDLVLCDSPPVIPVSDAVALAAQCDGVILVVRAGDVPAAALRRAAEHIQKVKGRILGVLLNEVNLREGYHADYYRYYRAYYGPDMKQ
jgi:capsular exopolysaccharide synthesis family protein